MKCMLTAKKHKKVRKFLQPADFSYVLIQSLEVNVYDIFGLMSLATVAVHPVW